MRRALARYGGVLLSPRKAVGAMHAGEGARDGVWLAILYVVAAGIPALVKGAADLAATRNFSGLVMLLSSLGRAVLVPILALVVVEVILGGERAHRRGVCLVPMVVAAAVLREVPMRAYVSFAYATEVIGVLLTLGLALWIRPAVPPLPAEGS